MSPNGQATTVFRCIDALLEQLFRSFPEWRQQTDIANPFHDRKCRCAETHDAHPHSVQTIWTFDLDADILRFDKKDQNLAVPLHIVRRRYVRIPDFEIHDQPPAFTGRFQDRSGSQLPGLRRERHPLSPHLQRYMAFIEPILRDFAFQWRHMLCNRYNHSTFRRFAYAIIRIISLNFEVKEVSRNSNASLVTPLPIPIWNPPNGDEHILRTGGDTIILCQHHPVAVALIDDYIETQKAAARCAVPPRKFPNQFNFLVLTVREAIRFDINRTEHPDLTEWESLLDGKTPLSSAAVELLLHAVQARSAPENRIRNLPIELQEMILDHFSNPIERARIGLILDIGIESTWKTKGTPIKLLKERPTMASSISLTDLHIYFDGHSSGLVYR
jgi:hypothetical protein